MQRQFYAVIQAQFNCKHFFAGTLNFAHAQSQFALATPLCKRQHENIKILCINKYNTVAISGDNDL